MSQIGNAIATRDNGPEAIVRQHKDDLTLVLPSHVKGETWMRLAYGVLRSNAQLMQVATRNPDSLMTALQDCARLGHEPGGNSFYFVPFGNEIQGIEGYRGVVERIYRAGAVKVVHAEVVYANDEFVWEPGTVDTQQPPRWEGPQRVPFHKADWFADRGDVKGAFSYGIFQDGTPSRVVIINRDYINKVRKESKGSESPKSPWVKWFDQMVLKTVAHRLEPWVPTSTEWRKEQLRAAAEVTAEQGGPTVIAPASTGPGYPEPNSPDDFNDDMPIEGEFVDD